LTYTQVPEISVALIADELASGKLINLTFLINNPLSHATFNPLEFNDVVAAGSEFPIITFSLFKKNN
jgi:hypothetical protein